MNLLDDIGMFERFESRLVASAKVSQSSEKKKKPSNRDCKKITFTQQNDCGSMSWRAKLTDAWFTIEFYD